MKKLNKFILLLVTLFLFPIKIYACPHVDEEGKLHFQFYSEDYTEMTMMYPRKDYLYNKNVVMDTKELLNEDFGFPLVQDLETYQLNYYFVDERLSEEGWEKLNIKTTVEGTSNMLVEGIGYNLDVGLTNTFNKSKDYIDDKLLQMYYNIYVSKIKYNKDEIFNFTSIPSKTYNNIKSIYKHSKIYSHLENEDLELVVPEILEITAEYFLMNTLEYDYETNNKEIKKFYDDIEIQIYNETKTENIIAVNLNNNINESTAIECTYDQANKLYKFSISEPGTYIIIKNTSIETIENSTENKENSEVHEEQNNVINEEQNNVIDGDEINEKNNQINLLIIITSVVIALIVFTIIIIKRKK